MSLRGFSHCRSLAWVAAFVVASLCLGLYPIAPMAGDWNIRRTDRWQKIAARLLALYVARPDEGYALRRLMIHFRRKGGTVALRKRLFQLRKKRPQDRNIRLAETLLSLHIGEYAKAVSSLKRLLAAPKLSKREKQKLNWHLARAYFREQRWGAARRLFLAQLAHTRSKLRQRKILRALIQLDSQRGAWKETRAWYQKLLLMRPRDLSLRLGLARALARQQLWHEAILQLKKAMPLTPRRRRPALWSKLVRYHLQVKQYPQALAAIDKARRMLAPTHWLHNALTALEIDAHRAQKTLPQLVAKYATLGKRSPKRYLPLKARLHVELGQVNEALSAYRLLLKRAPKHPSFTSAVTLLLEQKRVPEAIQWLQRRLKILPDDEATALQLLGIYHNAQQFPARDALFGKLLKQHAKNELFLGRLARKMQPWKGAFSLRSKLYQRLCSMRPDARCYEQWGELLWRKNQKKKARRVWRLIRQIKPLQADALFLLANIYRRHRWDNESIPILREIVQMAPRHIKARRLLGQIFLSQKKYRRAIPELRAVLVLSRSLRLRSTTRIEILRAYRKLYDDVTLSDQLKREYHLAPFKSGPRKLVLTYYIHLKRKRYAVRRYYRVSYRRRLGRRHWRYRRILRRRARYLRRYRRRVRYVYRTTPLYPWASLLLGESLKLFPKDPEFRLLALKVDEKGRGAWEHLRRLVMLDLSQSERYIRLLKEHAKRYNRGKELIALLQKMCVRWPYQASFWGHLGDVALTQRQRDVGCRAFARATKLAPKQLTFRLGRARCLASKQLWRQAHKMLLRLPHPHGSRLRREWNQQMTIFGLNAGIPLTELFLSYQRKLAQPIKNLVYIVGYLQENAVWNRRASNRKRLQTLVKLGWPMWKKAALQTQDSGLRARALRLLFYGPKKKIISTFKQVVKDRQPGIRGAAVLALALLEQRQLFYVVDRMLHYDRNYVANAAAQLAGSLMAEQFQVGLYRNASRWPQLRPWVARALLKQHKSISYQHMSMLANLYNNSKRATRWLLMSVLDRMTSDAVLWLEKVRTSRYYRCFAFDGLLHLQRKQAPAAIRKAAIGKRIYLNEFRKHCRFSLYAK